MGSPSDRNEMREDLIQHAEQARLDIESGDLSDFHEIKMDGDGTVYIDGEKQTLDGSIDEKPSYPLDVILKKFNIDRPKDCE